MSKLRIGTRLILAFLTIAALTGILGAFSYSRLQNTAQSYLSMHQVNSQSLELIGELSTTYQLVGQFKTSQQSHLSIKREIAMQ